MDQQDLASQSLRKSGQFLSDRPDNHNGNPHGDMGDPSADQGYCGADHPVHPARMGLLSVRRARSGCMERFQPDLSPGDTGGEIRRIKEGYDGILRSERQT